MALLLDDGIPDARRAVLLDLWHGSCRSARAAEPDALEAAGFVFRASSAGWRDVMPRRRNSFSTWRGEFRPAFLRVDPPAFRTHN